MGQTVYSGAPFGIQSARFDVSGIYPKRKAPGTFTEIAYDKNYIQGPIRKLGPGSHHVAVGNFSQKAMQDACRGPGWFRVMQLQKITAMPHLSIKEHWELKKKLERNLGPGTHDIKRFLDDKSGNKSGVCDTKTPRFKEIQMADTPGPGTYGDGGVPQSAIEEKSARSMSIKGLMDAAASTQYQISLGSGLAPGMYNVNGCTDLVKYRSGSAHSNFSCGYRSKPNKKQIDPASNIKTFMTELDTDHRKNHGKFGRMEQYPKVPSDRFSCSTLSRCQPILNNPGPGTYELKAAGKVDNSELHPFLSSTARIDRLSERIFTGNYNRVGAGRYDVERWDKTQQHQNGHCSVFKLHTAYMNKMPDREKYFPQLKPSTPNVRKRDPALFNHLAKKLSETRNDRKDYNPKRKVLKMKILMDCTKRFIKN